MRILTPYLVKRYQGRILNIHPSLLPCFKGLHAQQQALDYGVKIAGCTVHVVNEDMDSGPIIAQRAVPVLDGDTEETLSDRILVEEHKLYPEAVRIHAKKLFGE
jgi:phosphoribosylglycinamide formyltransferase-1